MVPAPAVQLSCVSAVLAVVLFGATARAGGIGTDLAGLGLCFYGDCEVRGAFAADIYGWTNPATLPAGTLPIASRAIVGSGTYYHVKAGDVGGDIGAGIATVLLDPWVLQFIGVYGEAEGTVRRLSPVEASLRTKTIALAAGLDTGRADFGPKGLSIGLSVALPVTENTIVLSTLGNELARGEEDREIDITGGVHYRAGRQDWFMFGAYVNGISNRLTATTAGISSEGSSNVWFSRLGFSLLPGLPLTSEQTAGASKEWLSAIRIAADLAHVDIAVPGEGSERRTVGYFGVDTPLVPDRWNPLRRLVRPTLIVGIDTDAGWGAGATLQGIGELAFLSCNPGYSSRPIAKSLGDRFNVWAATCTGFVPF